MLVARFLQVDLASAVGVEELEERLHLAAVVIRSCHIIVDHIT